MKARIMDTEYESASIESNLKTERYDAKGFPYNYIEENKPVYSYYDLDKYNGILELLRK